MRVRLLSRPLAAAAGVAVSVRAGGRLAPALGVLALVTVAVLWFNLDTQGRHYLVVLGGTAGAGLFLVVWNEL